MRSLGRWRATDAFRPDGGTYQTSPATALFDDQEHEGDAPPGRAKHVHVWLPPGLYGQSAPQAAPRRTHDAPMPQRPTMRRSDQQGPEPGTLLCKVAQSGDGSGNWRAIDINGNALQIANDGSGWLEVRYPNAEEEDPDQIAQQSPLDANAGGRNELTPGRMQTFEKRMAKAIAPSDRAHDRGVAGLRGLAELMRVHYRRA
jgi:hypothetical protein